MQYTLQPHICFPNVIEERYTHTDEHMQYSMISHISITNELYQHITHSE